MNDALRTADVNARRNASTQFDAPMVLEAGAGTGKTTALVGRIVAWCTGPGWERSRAALIESGTADPNQVAIAERVMSRVVAITFTERAAVEMGTKLALTLRDLARGAVADTLDATTLPAIAVTAPRATALVAALHLLRTSTIHGFCNRLLASYPIEAGVHPAFTIDSDGTLSEAVVRDLFTASLTTLYGSGQAEDEPAKAALQLAADGDGPAELHQTLEELVRLGIDVADLDRSHVGDAAADQARDRLKAMLDATLAVIAAPIRASAAQNKRATAAPNTLAALESLRAAMQACTGAKALVAALEQVDEKALGYLGDWAKYKFGPATLGDAVASVAREFAMRSASLRRYLKSLQQVDPDRFNQIAAVLQPLLADVQARLQRRGILGFDQLIRNAAELVCNHRDVAAKIAAGIDLLLVDEFQDTDKQQCRLIAAIALNPELRARPSLFLVGDPKQSIYGWRSADLDSYESFVSQVLNDAPPQRLSVNHRSVTPILQEVQRLTQPLLRYRRGIQPEFQELLTAPAQLGDEGLTSGGRRPVEYWLTDASEEKGTTRKMESRLLEARAIASDIAALHQAGQIALARVAILLRATTQQEFYLNALKEAGLPFVVEGDRSFYKRRETIDAVALLTTVLDPHDQVQLTAVLRGPLCGVPDAALLPLWQRQLPELASQLGARKEAVVEIVAALHAVARELPPGIPGIERIAGWEHAAAHTLTVIADLRRAYTQQPIDRFIETLRALLLHEETESARWLGTHRLANIEQLLRRFQAALMLEGGGTQAALSALRRAIADQRDEREAAVADETLDAVRVLSIHKAKGLTFDQVYLAALDHGSGGRGRALPAERRRSPSGTALRLRAAAEFGWADAVEATTLVSEAEAARVLYVAITRPAKRLVLCGGWSTEPGSDSLSMLAATRQGGAPLELLASSEHAELIDADGVRWLDLSRRESAVVAATRAASIAAVSDAAALHVAQRLAEARTTAVLRQARVLTASMSSSVQETSATPMAIIPSGNADTVAANDVAVGVERRRSLLAADDLEEADDAEHPQLSREARQTVGSLVHRALELLPVDAVERDAAWSDAIETALRKAEPEAAAEARALLERFRRGPLWARWWAVAPQIIGREIPLLLQPQDATVDSADDTQRTPLWAYAGAIDMLYRDPTDGRLVVADYKTDADPDPGRYALQLSTYARAMQRALRVSQAPRTELWLIAGDTIVTL